MLGKEHKDGIDPSSRADRKLLARAAKNRWPVKASTREICVETLARDLIELDQAADRNSKRNKRERRLIVAAIARLESQNQTDQLKEVIDQIHATHDFNPVEAAAEIRKHDPEYVEYLRQRALDDDAGPIRSPGQPGSVEDGPPPGPGGSRTNGRS